MTEPTYVVWHNQQIERAQRESLKRQRACVVWFTGLSGSGKSTIANLVDHQLYERGCHSVLLDGDNVRHSLNASPAMLKAQYGEAFAQRFGLGFGSDDRVENIRRIGAVSKLFVDSGLIVLAAFVSPYRRDRDNIRGLLDPGDFIEVFVDAPLSVCEQRDPKGLYKKARAGEIRGFTGIDDPYEAPLTPELVLATARSQPAQSAAEVVEYLVQAGKATTRPGANPVTSPSRD